MRTVDWSFSFDPESEVKILKIIKDLSDRYLDGSTFIPHITFFGVTNLTDEGTNDIVQEIIKSYKPFKIELNRISFAESISKTLFIEVDLNSEMQEIHTILKEKTGEDFNFNPHISLIYKDDLPMEERSEIIEEIDFPKELTINSIVLINAKDSKSDAKYFREWEVDRYLFTR